MSKVRAFVTGGAGCIGSNLCGRLLSEGYEITVYDNLTLGKREFIADYEDKGLTFIEADLLDLDRLKTAMKGADIVWHLAANSDISYGRTYTDWDLKNGTLATYNVLEAMRVNDVKKIVFASTSAIYGETEVFPTPEDLGPLFPISLYGASKLACEGLITAFCHNFKMQCWMFRFGNVVGFNGTHGALVDFIAKLEKNPKELEILGDGKQAKPYLYVSDIVDGMIFGLAHATDEVNAFNLACEGATSVDTIADGVVEALGLKDVTYNHTGGKRGWVGDVPQVRLSTEKMAALGWKASLDSDSAMRKAAQVLVDQLASE